MDDADRAQDSIDQDLAAALAAHHARVALPLTILLADAQGRRLCLDCGQPLDPRRRQALPGCIRCVECQLWAEQGR